MPELRGMEPYYELGMFDENLLHCPECNDEGYVEVSENGQVWMRECRCMPVRKSLRMAQKSGLIYLLRQYTLQNFRTCAPWQKKARDMAAKYVEDHDGTWFYIGGQVGAGKTHLCTGMVGEFLKRGLESYYMLWKDETVKLKAMVTNDERYEKCINALKQVKVLYIDDFLKTEKGRNPTSGDLNIAFELLNYRYINKDLITIISSERGVSELMDIDESVASRIYERAGEYCLIIETDMDKNFRLKRTWW